jgi:hypothetical protein
LTKIGIDGEPIFTKTVATGISSTGSVVVADVMATFAGAKSGIVALN